MGILNTLSWAVIFEHDNTSYYNSCIVIKRLLSVARHSRAAAHAKPHVSVTRCHGYPPSARERRRPRLSAVVLVSNKYPGSTGERDRLVRVSQHDAQRSTTRHATRTQNPRAQ
jgi:hypothetical protein